MACILQFITVLCYFISAVQKEGKLHQCLLKAILLIDFLPQKTFLTCHSRKCTGVDDEINYWDH